MRLAIVSSGILCEGIAAASATQGSRAGPNSYRHSQMTIGGVSMIYLSDDLECRGASDTTASVCLAQYE